MGDSHLCLKTPTVGVFDPHIPLIEPAYRRAPKKMFQTPSSIYSRPMNVTYRCARALSRRRPATELGSQATEKTPCKRTVGDVFLRGFI